MSEFSSYVTTAGDIKRLKNEEEQIRTYLISAGDEEILRGLKRIDGFFDTSIMYVGIPHETYPTKIGGSDLNLSEIPESTQIRIEIKTESLNATESTITMILGHFQDAKNDAIAGHARAILEIFKKISMEKYQGKTHQVPAFDSMAERLTY